MIILAGDNDNDLQEKSKEILEYITNEGFGIFYSREFDDYDIFDWDMSKDWKEFFAIAKNEGVKIIVANNNTFDSSKEDLIETSQSITEEDEQDDDLSFKEYDGKVGSYQFLWVKEGIKYSLSETTDWYKEYRGIESAIKAEYTQRQKMALRTEFLQEHKGEIPAILKSKSEEEFATELVEFIEKESPQASGFEIYTFTRLFWSSKGLFDHGLGPQADTIRRRIDMKAEKMFEQKRAKEEKERMPKLVEQCVNWARKNGLKKVILGEVGAFLTESDVNLSREGQRLLWQKVNLELKSRY